MHFLFIPLPAESYFQEPHPRHRRPSDRAARRKAVLLEHVGVDQIDQAQSLRPMGDGKPILTKEPKLLLNDNDAGKPEGIHFMIGLRPVAAFGNSTGDQQMLEYTAAGDGLRLKMLVLHDDAKREYAYGPAEGLADTKVGTFTQALFDEAKKDGWTVISMKNDWKSIFSWDAAP
jgi:hypothetical protein